MPVSLLDGNENTAEKEKYNPRREILFSCYDLTF